MSNPRDDERRKFEARFGPKPSPHAYCWEFGFQCWMARAEQVETPRAAQTREELEKEWLAQTEWQDFTNWLIHVKLPRETTNAQAPHR